jgi:hypothetical protein
VRRIQFLTKGMDIDFHGPEGAADHPRMIYITSELRKNTVRTVRTARNLRHWRTRCLSGMSSAINCKIATRGASLGNAECNQLQKRGSLLGRRTARILRQKRVPPPAVVLFDGACALIDRTIGLIAAFLGRGPQVPTYWLTVVGRLSVVAGLGTFLRPSTHGIRADHLHRSLGNLARTNGADPAGSL